MTETFAADTVTLEREGDIAVLTLRRPPVNALGAPLRRDLVAAIEAAEADPAVAAILVVGEGRTFCGGADMREFGTPARDEHPTSPEMTHRIEGCTKPVIAAMHGPVLGGGLGLGAACHYRICASDAVLGLPEVLRGLVPSEGLTQRIPRLVDLDMAVALLCDGTNIDPEAAKAAGLIDAVAEAGEDIRAAGLAFARDLVARKAVARPTRELVPERDAAAAADDLAAHRARIEKAARGFRTPGMCLDAIEAALSLPFEEGAAKERELAKASLATGAYKGLIHAFFAEKQALRIPDIPGDTPHRAIDRVAILGAGTMGGGIAMAFANAGIPVTVIETGQEALDRGLARIEATWEASRKRGRMSDAEMAARMALIEGRTDIAAVGEADLVIEAVFEEMSVKREVFAALDAAAKPGAILATNTSTLDVDEIARVTCRPSDVLGMHFFSPANVMTLLEIVRAKDTAKDVLATVLELSKRIGKQGVVVGVCDGFVGNRMLFPYFRQADFLVEEGALPQDVDGALEAFGLRMGPFRVSDLSGLDILWAIEKRKAQTRPAGERFSPMVERICRMERFGQKTGAGWYRYEDGRTARPDPEIEALIRARSEEMGIERRAISDAEIVDRCVLSLVNEGAALLGEGIAIRAADIDVVWLHGYGFPRHRGGPMFHADAQGLQAVVARLDEFHARWGDKWEPAPLLRELADAGKSFADYDRERG